MNKLLLYFSFTLFILLVNTSIGSAQDKLITGTINTEAGDPLPGVNIIIKGTTNGAISDFDGNFTLTVNEEDILLFRYVGYLKQEISVENKSEFIIQLKEDVSTLEEIVVTGYGKQTRTTLTSSISKMDTRVLETSTRSNAATALQGTVAGLRVTNTTGQPGATPDIVVRGGTGFDGGGSPLILVDGIPTSFYSLNSDDIESIEVLKDAAATAIYGARSANGVILVTTKSGKQGKSNINLKQKYSVNQRRGNPDFVGAEDFIRYNRLGVHYAREAYNNPNMYANFLEGPTAFGTGNNTTNSPFTLMYLNESNKYLLEQPGWKTMVDPLDQSKNLIFMDNNVSDNIYQDSFTSDSYLSFDGGNEKGTYYVGIGYLNNQGMVVGSGFDRFSMKFNGSYKITDKVKARSNIIYNHSSQKLSPLGDDATVFRRFAGQAPTSRIYNNNEDGSLSSEYNPGTNAGFGNPLYYQDKFIRDNLEQRLMASMGLDWEITKDLNFTVQGSHMAINNHHETFNKAYLDGGVMNTNRFASVSLARTLTNQITTTLDYSKSINNHDIDILVGGEYYSNNYFTSGAGTRGTPIDNIPTLGGGSEANGIPRSAETENRILSAFSRVNYSYDNRYLVTFTFRTDGSSKLMNNRFGFFPGISVGWNMHEEEFFKDSKVNNIVSMVKPRLSYGVNGNIDLLGDYQVYGLYNNQGIYRNDTGYGSTSLPIPDLKWERSTTLNAGLDIGFFENRLSFIAEYFVRDVHDKLSELTLPHYTGFNSVLTNNGVLRNKGFELTMNTNIIRKEDLNVTFGAIVSQVKNYVVQLPSNGNVNNRQGGTQVYNPNTGQIEWVGGLQEGQRVGTDLVITYVPDGIYRNQDEVDADADLRDDLLPNPYKRYPGDVRWKDRNGDGVIDSYDMEVIGRTTPTVTGGFNTNIRYKKLSLFVQADYAVGHMVYNHIRGKGLAQTQGNLNQDATVLNSWTPDNPNTDVPRMVFVDAQRNYFRGNEATVNANLWEKGDYLALREVTFSYSLESEKFKKAFKRLDLYVTGSNLLYLTGYSGMTPERGGYQHGEYPMPRTYTFGINLTL